MFHRVGESRCGRNAIGEAHRDTSRGGYFSDNLRKALGQEPGVVGDAEAASRVLFLPHVVSDGPGCEPHIGFGEVGGKNSPPAIGPELDGVIQLQSSSSCLPARWLTTRRTSCERSLVVIRMASSVSTTTRSSTPTNATNFPGL